MFQKNQDDKTILQQIGILSNQFQAWLANIRDNLPEIIRKMKNLGQSNYELGLIYMRTGEIREALFRFRLSNFFRPNNAENLYNMGLCYLMLGNYNKAADSIAKSMDLGNEVAEAPFMLSLARQEDIQSLPAKMVIDYFDALAPFYNDEYLTRLSYQGHKLIFESLSNSQIDIKFPLDILDIGCGTGLVGELLKPYSNVLDGVDFSSKMVELATLQKNDGGRIYSSVVKSDIREFLKATARTKYDLITASLVFNYIGDLEEIFSNARNFLNDNGLFAFSVEKSDDLSGYNLAKGQARFCHSKDYIDNLAKKHGYKVIDSKEATLLSSPDGQNIIGLQYLLRTD